MMDTRCKIISAAEAVESANSLRSQGMAVTALIGTFDVLRKETLDALNASAKPGWRIFAIVVETPEPLLKLQARAELAAALRCVDFAIPLPASGPCAEQVAESLHPSRVLRETDHHHEITARLIDHVRRRNGAESGH